MLGRVIAGEVEWNAAHPTAQEAPDRLRSTEENRNGVIAETRRVLQ